VLQQDMPVRIWGPADTCESVSMEFRGRLSRPKPLAAAGPLEMSISASNRLVVKDVVGKLRNWS
jgi:hypothetical protein